MAPMKNSPVKDFNTFLKLNTYAKTTKRMLLIVMEQSIEPSKSVEESNISYWKVMDHPYFA